MEIIGEALGKILPGADGRIQRGKAGPGEIPVAFGVVYAAMPDQPTLKDQQDPISIFKTALAERLSKNGIAVTNYKDTDTLSVDLLVRQFKLDFNFGKWTGEVGYVAKVSKNGDVLCQDNIYEKSTAFNLYVCHEAAQEMREGPSEPACRSWLQTTLSCDGKEPSW